MIWKESTKAQHEVDKAEFAAAKAEAKASFEENKFHNTYAKAKADAKKSWDDAQNLLICVLSKMLLVSVFVPIYLVMSVVAKQKLWLSLVLSMMVGMFLFMMIPMLTPLNATVINLLLCAVAGTALGFGLGAVGNLVLKKTSLV